MARRILYLAILSITATLYGCAFLCRQPTPPPCNPELLDLMLTDDDFPAGWSRGTPVQDDEFREGAIDSCLVSFYVLNGVAGQIINEYRNEEEAIQGYTRLVNYFSWEGVRSLPTPSYVSHVADSYFVECAIPKDTPMCQFLARYDLFVVCFDTHFRPEFMTQDDFMRILQAIDNRMATYLNDMPVR